MQTIAVCAVAGTAALVAAEPSYSQPGGLKVSQFELSNGLTVVVIPDHRTPVVTHMIWYRVGSAD
jgi:zinc protease